MGKFDGRGDSLNLKSDKGRVLSSLISRIKHLLNTSTQHIGKYANPKNYKKLEECTIKKPNRKTTQPNGRVVYEKDLGRRIGTKGEEKLRVVIDPVKNKIIASFPEEQFITS